MMDSLFNVSVDKDSVWAIGIVIRDILAASVDQSTMVVALETLKESCSPVVTVEGCTFTNAAGEKKCK